MLHRTISRVARSYAKQLVRRVSSGGPIGQVGTVVGPVALKSKRDAQWRWNIGLVGAVTFGGGLLLYYGVDREGVYSHRALELVKSAIWEESNVNQFQYGAALKGYMAALEQMQSESMDPLSDNYTRVELKIAEMLEKLGMMDEAKNVYLELLYRLFDALNSPDKVPFPRRSDLLRKDLRVLIKSLELNQDVEAGKRRLLAHLLLAQEDVLMKSPELKEFFDKKKERADKIIQGIPVELSEFQTFVNGETINLDKDGFMTLNLQRDSTAWEPFKEEIFIARDLYTAYCLSTKDITSALSCKMTTVEWMIMADMPPGQILLGQANLGSLLYLQAERLESDIATINLKTDNDPSLLEDENVIKALRRLYRNKDNCLTMAGHCYEGIVDFFQKNKKLRYHMKDQLDNSVAQAIALSTYGKGILHLHDGSLPKAERLLNDSITMAREADFKELLKEAEQELNKLKEMRSKESEDAAVVE
ncbi:Mgr3p KNAG_0E02320 [Huiozyma naganishii CBS 8797]|uniref:Mitochondrial inner membrane i-AAA protease supercomplex subunit MGR3 n=1 Tax=Huiozyma naganishii (strain ATCC MYA-139 / BCRC 22969 / CBS 8797 / KCTC 17520 / NBRC 10181 / NCYC 3082 / Yp74L-3) TaxID=1071383 RepID=J7RLT7_HUIN7|nr:hypothetical protein KNAG_0E02320 [Kazachstania naganishii CBS 8797]CCK70493.1 hypothetical protein KNAG_0E02320 [Kazachstania naganishii CBS 8797]